MPPKNLPVSQSGPEILEADGLTDRARKPRPGWAKAHTHKDFLAAATATTDLYLNILRLVLVLMFGHWVFC